MTKQEKRSDAGETTSETASKKRKRILLPIVVIVIVVVAAVAILSTVLTMNNTGATVSEVNLKKAVSINKLSTAEFTYEGIAEKCDDNGKVVYHIYYEASATAGMDLEKIDFKIDPDKKTVTPILPKMSIDTPVIDESVIDFLPKNANINMREVIQICKADASNEIKETPAIKETALRNMRSTIEALLVPILESNGYQIVWEDTSEKQEVEDTDTASNGDSAKSEAAEGDSNENA